jgi:DNA-binding response OmpR family regulator
VGHCAFELHGGSWFAVDGGGVNGTFLRRGATLERITGRRALDDGDVVCVLAALEDGERSFFELVFHRADDSQATRAAPASAAHTAERGCLRYEAAQARLVLEHAGERREIQVRAQAHRLVSHMAARNAAVGGAPALCTHDELIRAVWADEPMHSRTELARLVWELRRALEPFGAAGLVESERRRGYRLRTCTGHE